MKILVTSDSTCALARSEAEKIGLPILPLNVIVDGEEYHDGIDIDQEKLCKMMRGGSIIKTSTPTPYEIEEFFDAQFAKGFDHIIHFTISSKLSSMFSLFTTHCKEKYGDKVTIIDSLSVCQMMLDHVLTAINLANEGKDVETIVKEVNARIGTEDLLFIPESLTYLKNGGRISPALAFIGNMIGLKPLLTFNKGEIGKEGTTRNVKKGIIDRISKMASGNFNKDDWHLVVVYFDTDEKLIEFAKNQLEENLPGYEILTTPLSINVCAHTGPGTIGIGISRKPNH